MIFGTRSKNSGSECAEYAAFAKTALARNHEGKENVKRMDGRERRRHAF